MKRSLEYPCYRRINGEELRKGEFVEKYKPKLLEDWEKWDNSEEFRIIFREKLTKSEFIRSTILKTGALGCLE